MKKHCKRLRSACTPSAWLLAIVASGPALAAAGGTARSAPSRIEPYLMVSRQREIALARSAAPASISTHATVMVLGAHGYVTALRGSDGFVCLVVRSWDNKVSVKSAEFWNPRFRAPFCFNAAGARSVLPRYLMRTQWVVGGASRKAIGVREEAAWAKGELEEPKPGAVCYMMSKRGHLNDGTAWHPHLMFYFPRAATPNWGANLPGNPVFASADEDTAVFYVLVPVWSDGSPAPAFK